MIDAKSIGFPIALVRGFAVIPTERGGRALCSLHSIVIVLDAVLATCLVVRSMRSTVLIQVPQLSPARGYESLVPVRTSHVTGLRRVHTRSHVPLPAIVESDPLDPCWNTVRGTILPPASRTTISRGTVLVLVSILH
jgi:hypothetical protein